LLLWWLVPAPTSISKGCSTTQPCAAQKFCNLKMICWNVSMFALPDRKCV
jgi:hypothetical protein